MEKCLTLKRVSHDDDGTYGVLVDQTTPFAVTLEDPWLENRRDVSCIPAGSYRCRRIKSPRFGDVFLLEDVPERSHVLVHKVNTEEDTRGCLLVGEQFESLQGKTAILASRKGFREFMDRLKGCNEFILLIAWV